MNLFALSFTLFAAACLAAQTSTDPIFSVISEGDAPLSKFDRLKDFFTKHHPEALPLFLMTIENWDEKVARAFVIGQLLGKCDVRKNANSDSSSNSSTPKMNTNCVMLEFERGGSMGADIKVDMNSLQSVISAIMKWKSLDGQTYNPSDELFDLDGLYNQISHCRYEYASRVRHQFANYARSELAMMAGDVAILKWMVHAIKEKPKDYSFLHVSRNFVLGICSLSMHPTIEGLCRDDILLVLTHLQHSLSDTAADQSKLEYYRSSLVTLIKFLDNGPIRDKVMEILTKVCSLGRHDFVNSRMILGADDPFIKRFEEKSEFQLAKYEQQVQEEQYKRKLYSMVISSPCDYKAKNEYAALVVKSQLIAVVDTKDGTLKWTEQVRNTTQKTTFYNIKTVKGHYLFICSPLIVPAALWQELTSFTNLSMLQAALKNKRFIRMIFTYELSIIESSSVSSSGKIQYTN